MKLCGIWHKPITDLPARPAILVTRPAHQASAFVDKLHNLGFHTVLMPAIEIAFRTQSLQPLELRQLDTSELWIFTSANAVEGARKCGIFSNQSDYKIACIGVATAAALTNIGISIDYAPPKSGNSENLIDYLLASGWQPTSAVTIVRGSHGREALKKSLHDIGCAVHYLDVYQRLLPTVTETEVQQALAILPAIISVTSNQGLENLLKIIPARCHSSLFNSHLVVNSERCAILALKYGFKQHIAVAKVPGDDGQLKALEKLMADIL